MPLNLLNRNEHAAALARIEMLMDARRGTPEGDELELLSTLVDLYEKRVYPIDRPDPVEAIRFRMEQRALTAKDLVPYIGSKSKVSEVLSRRRGLSLNMIRGLSAGLGIPADILVRETRSGYATRKSGKSLPPPSKRNNS